jgi:hypothetical protein
LPLALIGERGLFPTHIPKASFESFLGLLDKSGDRSLPRAPIVVAMKFDEAAPLVLGKEVGEGPTVGDYPESAFSHGGASSVAFSTNDEFNISKPL